VGAGASSRTDGAHPCVERDPTAADAAAEVEEEGCAIDSSGLVSEDASPGLGFMVSGFWFRV
jgi:hypothetical protein